MPGPSRSPEPQRRDTIDKPPYDRRLADRSLNTSRRSEARNGQAGWCRAQAQREELEDALLLDAARETGGHGEVGPACGRAPLALAGTERPAHAQMAVGCISACPPRHRGQKGTPCRPEEWDPRSAGQKGKGRQRCRRRPRDDAAHGLAFAPCAAAPGGVLKPDAVAGRAGTTIIRTRNVKSQDRRPSADRTHRLILAKFSTPTLR